MLHRDLKPSNVLIDTADRPQITDFGLAKYVERDSGLTQTGDVMGTPNYMPPEQALAEHGQIGPRSDVYSMGAILYEMLTSRPPFVAATVMETLKQVLEAEPASPRSVNSSVPKDLETICLKCLEKEPSRRYASAQELADDLGRFLAGEPIHARPIGALERGVKWARRRPVVAALSAAVVLVTIFGFAGVTWKWRDEAKARQKLEYSHYFHQLALAYRQWLGNFPGEVERTLRECKPGFRRWEWNYVNHLCHREILVLRGHAETVTDVAFSPDGHLVASGDASGVIKIWDGTPLEPKTN